MHKRVALLSLLVILGLPALAQMDVAFGASTINSAPRAASGRAPGRTCLQRVQPVLHAREPAGRDQDHRLAPGLARDRQAGARENKGRPPRPR